MAEKASIILDAEDRTRAAFASLKNNLKGIEQQSAAVSRAMSGIGAGLSVVGFAAFAKSGIDAADSLNDMSQRLGVTVKDLASFKLAAEQSGTSLDSVGVGIARLTKSIGEAEAGNKGMAQALLDLGITARDPKEAFFQLADAVQRIQDPATRSALLSQVLGKSYGELVPLLSQGGEELRRSAQASESFADAMARLAPDADAFNDQLATLKNNAAAAAAQGLIPLVQAINTTIERFGELARLRGAGASIADLVTGSVSADTKNSLSRVNDDIADIERTISRLSRNSGGLDSSIAPLTQRLNSLKAVRAELQAIAAEEINRPPKSASNRAANNQISAAGDSSLQISCIASGGTWDGKNCIRKKTTSTSAGSKSDPLAGLLGSTDIGKLAAFEKQVALLNARFDSGRKSTELYEQAMTKLVETTFAGNFRQFAEDQEFMNLVMQDSQNTINEANRNTREWQETVAATSKELFRMVNPTAQLVEQLGELDKFDGFIDPELLAAARLEINAQIDSVNGLGNEIKKTKSFGEEFGLTMKSAFEDAVIEGKDFRDVLGGIASDLQRILLRKTITEPLGNAFSGFFNGIDFGSLFGFASGGVMTSRGPLPLHAYASGGIASRPQLALFGEGRMNEAFVPLPDGRSIPVTMTGGGAGQVILQQTIQIDARGADSGVEARIRQAAADGARQGYSMVVDDLSRGGPVARLVGRA